MTIHWTPIVTLICAFLSVCNARRLSPLEIAIRSNLPKGQSLTMFLEVCEACGEMYGSHLTHLCLTRPHEKAYDHCLVAVGFKRYM